MAVRFAINVLLMTDRLNFKPAIYQLQIKEACAAGLRRTLITLGAGAAPVMLSPTSNVPSTMSESIRIMSGAVGAIQHLWPL